MDLQLSLEIDKQLKDNADFLVGKVNQLENIMRDIIKQMRTKEDKLFGKSQIQNLLNAVENAISVKEIVLYIQYQMSRDEKGNSWRKSDESNVVLGDQIIRILKEIEQKALEGFADKGHDGIRELSLRLSERFFKYWYWKYSYLLTEYGNQKPFNNGKGGKRK